MFLYTFSGARSDHSNPFFFSSSFLASAMLTALGGGAGSSAGMVGGGPAGELGDPAAVGSADGGAPIRDDQGLAGPGINGAAPSGEAGAV